MRELYSILNVQVLNSRSTQLAYRVSADANFDKVVGARGSLGRIRLGGGSRGADCTGAEQPETEKLQDDGGVAAGAAGRAQRPAAAELQQRRRGGGGGFRRGSPRHGRRETELDETAFGRQVHRPTVPTRRCAVPPPTPSINRPTDVRAETTAGVVIRTQINREHSKHIK